MVKSAEALLAFQLGDWDQTRRLLLECQDILRYRAPATSWDTATGQLFLALTEWTSGRYRDLRRRWEDSLRDARERQDEYFRLALDAVVSPMVYLLDDEPESALAALDGVGRQLYRGGVGFLHALRASNLLLIALYAGEPERALGFMRDAELAPALQVSARRHYSRVFGTFIRGTTVLAAEPERRELVESAIERLTDDLIPWADALAIQLRGALEWHLGRQQAACAAFDRAARRFAALGLLPFELAARHALGRAVAGADGCALVASAESELALQGVANPARFLRMFAPLP